MRLKAKPALQICLLAWEAPGAACALAFEIYLTLALIHGPHLDASPAAYYSYLADAFLHGQLHLRLRPDAPFDLSLYHGRTYLYWPPLPAVLLAPFVAVFGIRFSDVLFNVAAASLNVALVSLVLRVATRSRVVRLYRRQRAWLVLFFALGTVHLALAPLGGVWGTSQLTGFGWVSGCYFLAMAQKDRRATLGVGTTSACALLTRNNLLLAGLWPAYYVICGRHRSSKCPLVRSVALVLSPVLVAFAILATYNWIRFGNPTDIGYAYHQMNPMFVADYHRYGPFSLHYVSTNIYYQYLVYPFPPRPDFWMGGSLFLLSPLFFGAPWALWQDRRRIDIWLLFATIMAVNIPILLLMGTGWVQFGPRYTLDFTLPLLLLTAHGIRRWPEPVVALLTLISVGHYLVGTMLFILTF
jgi:hypothetical protein